MKRISDDKYLLAKNTVIVNKKKNNTERINSLLYQVPNRKILGVPLRLHIYNMARPNRDSLSKDSLNRKPSRLDSLKNINSEKQVNKFRKPVIGFNNWLKTTGEAPIEVSEEKTIKTVKRLKDYHINNGWFNVKTNYDIIKNKNQHAEVKYKVETGKGFVLDSISSKVSSPAIRELYENIKNNSLIETGKQYKTANFENERDRISSELRNSGIYYFNQDYVSFEIDTVGTNKKVNVSIQIQDRAIRTTDSIIRTPFKVYHIDEVNIITDYTFENRGKPFQDSIRYNGYNLYAYNKIGYRPKAITDAMFINPGTIFKDIDRTRTYRYINELRTFKYPNIEYVENEYNTLTDTIRLTPLKKFSLGLSADVSQSNIQTVGLSINPSLLIRNFFKGAETLQISGIAAIGSSDERNDGDPFFDINEIGIDLKLTIPRLFSPFYTEKIIPRYMSPSTRISLSTTSQTNIGLDKQRLVGTFNYNWYPNTKTTNKLDLFNIQYVRNLNAGNYFGVYQNSFNLLNQTAKDVNYTIGDLNIPNPSNPINQADEFIDYALAANRPQEISVEQRQTINGINERKNRLTENNLILSSSFSFIKDQRTNIFDNDFSFFRFKLEFAGNLLAATSSLIGLKRSSDGRYELLNVAFSQYVKTEFNYVKHWDLGRKNVFAMRSFLGIAIPYGNSTNIPFAKSFFAGGPNDNRAWTAYSLGPGSSETTNEFNEANLKFALSIEQRFNIFEKLNGAVFIDAGNIWNVLDDVEEDRATFSSIDSFKDIAIGSGIGLRYDFSFFVFRFDIGFKTYDPSYKNQNRWFNDYNFKNAVYNIGINYPF